MSTSNMDERGPSNERVSGEAMEDRASEGKLVCDHCQERFKRREHLNRHRLRHSGVKPFPCQLCSKAFPRRDTLQRHMSMHGKEATPLLGSLSRTSKACKPCAKSKQRCDGEQPCQRCKQRGIVCIRRTSLPLQEEHSDEGPSMQGSVSNDTSGRSQGVPGSPTLRTRTVPTLVPQARLSSETEQNKQMREARRASIAGLYASPYPNPSATNTTIYQSIETADRAWLPANSLAGDGASGPQALSGLHSPTARGSRRPSLAVPRSEADVIAAESFDHVPRLPASTYAKIVQFYEEHRTHLRAHAMLPGIDHLNSFVQLYFEHYSAKLPLIHMPTFVPSDESWLLVLAIAAVGCEYSELCTLELMALFEHLAMRAITITMTLAPRIESMSIIQSVLIFSLMLLYDGSEEHLLFLQHHRSLLVTACRKLIARHAAEDTNFSASNLETAWKRWVAIEQERRFVSMVLAFECLQYITFDVPPTLAGAELVKALPCSNELWCSSSAEQWRAKYGNTPPNQTDTSIASLIASGPMTVDIVSGLGDVAFLHLFLTLLVAEKRLQEIYELWIRPRVTRLDRSDGSVIHKVLDADMNCLEQDVTNRPGGDFQVSFEMLSIFRLTPFSTLCIFAGFRAGHQTAEEAKQTLQEILQKDQARSRRTLLYAGRLFAHFRDERLIPRSDLQAFLATSLYIWAWVKLAIPATGDAAENVVQSIRVDQGLASPLAQRWIDNGTGLRTQLSGVGILTGADAASRVLKEAARVMRAKAHNSTLGRSMADSCVRVVLS